MTTVTVGQPVFFHPRSNSQHHNFAPGAILAATVACVNDDGTVNLGVLDSSGQSHAIEKVPVVQDGDTPPENGYYVGTAAPEPAVEPSPFSTAAEPVTTV